MKKLNFKAPEWLSNAFRSRPLQYITFIGIITGLVYFIGRQAGRESFGDYKPKKLPEDPDWTPDLLVSQIWDVLDGWFTLASDKEEVFIALMASLIAN
ncbi:MAG: hypothetical protein MUE30_05735 [Spirosomaceae bacterium]|jgi:hypothetical protein|nr:hypothetical protein [Spirosomataceae bacterium]